jgi:di/tricarboxylate transporter
VLIERTEKEEAAFEKDSDRGFIEVLIPARSSLAGKTVREAALQATYQAQLILFFSDRRVIIEGLADRMIKAGDTLILHGRWENLQYFKDSPDFITVTPIRYEPRKPEKAWFSVACFVGSILLVFFSGLPISIGFLTGALAMIVGGVMTIEDAYRAVEWKVVFLIAGLIPIGIAMETSGAATLMARHLVNLVEGAPPFLILLTLGGLTTVCSLLMSNVAATVLLVPLVLEFSGVGGLSSEALVLLVGLCAANSFIIPTHQVNALLMTPGGYRVSDYLKAGAGLTILFLLVSVSMISFFYG